MFFFFYWHLDQTLTLSQNFSYNYSPSIFSLFYFFSCSVLLLDEVESVSSKVDATLHARISP
jgi:hypothetical protein